MSDTNSPNLGGGTMTYKTEDLILPMLKLEKAVTIRITEDEKYLRLYVGPRDWQFSKETGECVAAGTALCD